MGGVIETYRVGLKFSVEEMSKRRRGLDITHAFVKRHYVGSLDLASLEVFIICMSNRLLVSQEDPRTSMYINFGVSRFSRKGTDVTTKHMKEREIGAMASAQFKCQCSAIIMWEAIRNEHKMT